VRFVRLGLCVFHHWVVLSLQFLRTEGFGTILGI
jgi:hypothetical protein